MLIEVDCVVVKYGVMLVGYINFLLMVVVDVFVFYVCNVFDFFKLIIDKDGGLNINCEDDIVVVCLFS